MILAPIQAPVPAVSSWRLLALGALLTVGCGCPRSTRCAAQFASSVNVVEVYATVTDATGQPVTGLKREDFVVRENGETQR